MARGARGSRTSRRPLWPLIRRVWVMCGALAGAGFVGWSLLAYRANGVARRATASDATVAVTRHEDGWSFAPSAADGAGPDSAKSARLLFFPGAMVDPVAYAPLAHAVAGAGYEVRIVELPRRALFGGADDGVVLGRAEAAMRSAPAGIRWVVAGHSKGGAVAARYMHERGAGVAALVLIGTSHPRDFSLAGISIPVTKILGTLDGVAEVAKSEANRELLPPSTRWVLIEGGNHSQFGDYGFQPGDAFASISRDEQRERTARALVEALAGAARRP